jgi:hypothetical protein
MDSGIAAVLGALAGSLATIGAALATGWAQREGARITARSQHRRERREPREEIYKEFISRAARMNAEAAMFAITMEFTPPGIDSDMVEDWSEKAAEIREKSTDVVLAGPKEITKIAIALETLSGTLSNDLRFYVTYLSDDRPPTLRLRKEIRRGLLRKARKFDKAFKKFMSKAQLALDDDGSLK